MTTRELMLKFAKELGFPLEAVTQKFAIMGQSGGGKSYAAMKLAELMLAAGAQIVVVDIPGVWYGLRSSADGKHPGFKVLVCGGEHGDIPIHANAGALIADLVVDREISVVLDVSQMLDSEQIQFLTDFATRFFDRKKRNKSPVHLFLEECQEIIPEQLGGNKGAERLRSIFVRMMKIGRNFGIGWSAITQEPQAASKRAINQAGTIIAVRTVGGHERKALETWARSKAKTKEQLALMDVLPELEQGQALVWSPGWLRHSEVVHVLPKETFDSSATPKVGEKRPHAKVTADIDLDKLISDMASLVQKAEAEDPKLLQKKILELQRELTAKKIATAREYPVTPAAAPKQKVVQESVLLGKDARELATLIRSADSVSTRLADSLTKFATLLQPMLRMPEKLTALTAAIARAQVVEKGATRVEVVPMTMPAAAKPAPLATRLSYEDRPRSPPPLTVKIKPMVITEVDGEEVKIGTGEQRMLDVLANQHPKALTKKQLAIMSGFTMKGGTFRTYLPKLRTIGLVAGGTGSDPISLTEAGCEAAASAMKQGPRSAAEVQAMWRNTLGAGEQRILDAVIGAYPADITCEDLGKATGFEVGGGTFRTYLPKLHTLGLIEYGSGKGPMKLVRAALTLVQPEAA